MFFFGLIRVPQYDYDWGYSKAYIELLCMDTTIIHYPDAERDKKNTRDERAEEATRMYMERKAQKEKNANTIKLKE